MKIVTTHNVPHQFAVILEQHPSDAYRTQQFFRVTYGHEVYSWLTYAAAAKHFGECVMHACACAGSIEEA